MNPDGIPHGQGPYHAAGEVASQSGRALMRIRECLLRGEFPGHERISEYTLSERLNMSHTPVRRALERLAQLSVLEADPYGGFFVREFTVVNVRDAYDVRGALEGTAARLAAEGRHRPAELDRLRRIRDRLEELDDVTPRTLDFYMDCNESFHDAILDLSHSPLLKRMVAKLNTQPFVSLNAMAFSTPTLDMSSRTLATAQAHHRALVDAIENGDGAAAESLAREHARLGRIAFDRLLTHPALLGKVAGGPLGHYSA